MTVNLLKGGDQKRTLSIKVGLISYFFQDIIIELGTCQDTCIDPLILFGAFWDHAKTLPLLCLSNLTHKSRFYSILSENLVFRRLQLENRLNYRPLVGLVGSGLKRHFYRLFSKNLYLCACSTLNTQIGHFSQVQLGGCCLWKPLTHKPFELEISGLSHWIRLEEN